MTPYRATPEQWAMLEEQSAPEYDSTILELRARVEALEASAPIGQLAAPANTEAQPAGLVERVAEALADEFQPSGTWHDEARVAIREVAAWMREADCGYNVVRWLEREADRG